MLKLLGHPTVYYLNFAPNLVAGVAPSSMYEQIRARNFLHRHQLSDGWTTVAKKFVKTSPSRSKPIVSTFWCKIQVVTQFLQINIFAVFLCRHSDMLEAGKQEGFFKKTFFGPRFGLIHSGVTKKTIKL